MNTGNAEKDNTIQPIDIREYQTELLHILDSFITICRKHGLEFYLNAGSLLGAVRHQGFIPWDDDIDLCMPRSDYEKFLSYAADELPGNLRCVWFGVEKKDEHPQYHCQIQDLSCPIIQMTASVPRKTYAWIDVFPLDGMPSNMILRIIHGFRILYWRMRMQLSMFDHNVNISKKNRPFYEKLLIWMFSSTGWGRKTDTYAIMRKLDDSLKRYSDMECSLWVNFMGAYKLKETIAVKDYRDGVPYLFEGRKLNGPRNADAILKKLYGEYLTPVKPQLSEGHKLYLDLTKRKENHESSDS